MRENLQKKVRANDFVDQLFVKCKEHGGPVTSEVNALVRKKSPELKTYLGQEIPESHDTDHVRTPQGPLQNQQVIPEADDREPNCAPRG